MKAYEGVDAYSEVFLFPVLVVERSASGLGLFTPFESCS
jgi:hypothetical protein